MPQGQTTVSVSEVEPSSAKTAATGTSANTVLTESTEHFAVYVQVTLVTAGQIDSIAVEVTPIKESPVTADFVELVNPTLNITTTGMTLVGVFSRSSQDELGVRMRATWVLSGTPDITFRILAVRKA